jgi:predicted dehydrogenase
MKQINVAVIGTGGAAAYVPLHRQASPWVKELHIAEIRDDRLNEVAAQTRPATADYRLSPSHREPRHRRGDDLHDTGADALSDSQEAMLAGKHVFLEKPIALELSEADELIQISRKRNLLFTIGYSQRFNPKFAYVKRSLEDGTIGEPVSALVSRHITRNLGKKISGRVRLSPAAMESTHDIDFVLWCLAPRKPIRVYAQEAAKIMKTQYNAPDCVWMIVTMDDGTLFTVGGGWVLPPAYPNFSSTWIEFVGTEGAVMVDDTHRDVYVTTMKDGIRFPISSMPGEKVNHVYAGPMEAETLHFLECVATGKQPLVTPEHARLVMLVYQAPISPSSRTSLWS